MKNSNPTPLPQTLFRFYYEYAFKPLRGTIIAWMILFVASLWFFALFPLGQQALFQMLESANWSMIWWVIALLPGAMLMGDVCEIASFMFMARWRSRAQHEISSKMNEYVLNQSMEFYSNRIAGKIHTQIGYIGDGFNTLFDFVLMFSAIVVLVFLIGMVFTMDIRISSIFFGALVMRLIFTIWRLKSVNRASKAAADSWSTVSGTLVDSIINHNVVKLFAGREAEIEHAKPLRRDHIVKKIYSHFVQRVMWAVPSVFYTLCFCAILGMCLWLFREGAMKLSDIVFTLSAYWQCVNQIQAVTRNLPTIVDALGSAAGAYTELNKPIAIVDKPDAPDLVVTRGEIKIKNLSFGYGKNGVLKNLSLDIKPGEKVGLVGSSGAGKSTLVNLIMRLYDPKSGSIEIDGQDIRDVNGDSLRREISFIPQDANLFNRTLADNIRYGKPDATLAQVRAAARRASADAFIMKTEKKYDSMVGDRGIKLSGGQKQRIAIARAFLKDAPILILDEATAALDSETEQVIQKSFTELSHGRTTIAIAHRLSTLRNMDRIVVLDHGRIVESGTHDALIKKRGGHYARMWRMQSGGFIQNQ
ncbi:MAG: ABC transporter ATP-binding protein/permease [Rickettsiales bacterium]|jgi:ATP-binding cassette subfamily B multidrug efflux pump|nr:ABC transporter ATP-binding protein/permease [Rickettsiales bacterium]